jgi:hypothetical protein
MADWLGHADSALWDLRFRKSEHENEHDSVEPLAAPPDGSPLRFAPSFLQSLEPGPFLVVLGGLDFLSLGISVPQFGTFFFCFCYHGRIGGIARAPGSPISLLTTQIAEKIRFNF